MTATSTPRYRSLLLSWTIAAIILACPFVLERLDSRYHGGPLYFGSDSSHYVVRLEQGLIEPWGDTGNGIFSLPDDPAGLQPAGLERIAGLLFGWTGWRATEVSILLTILLGATVVPLLQLLLTRTGLSARAAFAGSALYFFLFLGPISRFVHQSWSLPMTLFALLLLWRFFEQRSTRRAGIAGIALGLLPYVYYWSWTFAWTLLLALTIVVLARKEERRSAFPWIALWLVMFAVASPYFIHMAGLLGNPVAREAAERSSVVFARGIESYPRSILTFLLAVFAFLVLVRKHEERTLLPIAAACIAIPIVMHQQFIHGEVISFSTHYYPYVCLVALLFAAALLARGRWNPIPIVSFMICIAFLGGAFVDYSKRYPFRAIPMYFQFQQFDTLLPVLDQLPKQVILTDHLSALIVAANTKHDVVFTEHARHLLISTTEYAERYCLTTLFAPDAHPEWVADTLVETGRLGRARQDELHAERLQITTDACTRIRNNPKQWLEHYAVTELLWDEKDHPEWNIDPLLFEKMEQGEGWSLWKLR